MELGATSAEEIDLIARYLAGRLSETESARLEARVAAEPGLYKRVEEVLRLQEGLAVLAQRDELDTLLRERPWRSRLGVLGAAAVLALAVIGLCLWWASREPPAGVLAFSVAELQIGARALTIEGPYMLARTRGDAGVLEVAPLNVRRAIELKLVPSVSSTGGRYRLTVEPSGAGGGHALVGTLDSVALGPDGYVTVFLDSAALTSGTYTVTLKPSGPARADEGDRFEFRVPSTERSR
jgi:hypothetical protein